MSDIEIRVVSKQADLTALDQTDKKVKELGGTLRRVGETAAGFLVAQGVQAGARRAIALMQSTVTAASDLGESINAVEKTFGSASGKIKEFGETSAEQVGLSNRAFNQMATPLGAMLKNTGMALDQVADETINLTKRAADVASVFNVEVNDALFAFQAALRGESEPARRFGVDLSEINVQQKALATTGKTAAKELTAQEKAAARLALIYEQTADSAGDFAETGDSLANAQRKATAAIEDAKAKVGTAFLPVMAKAAEVTRILAESFSSLPPQVQLVTAGIVALAAASVIVIPRVLAMKVALDAAAAAGSRAAVGLTAAATAAIRFLPWLAVLAIQEKGTRTLTKLGDAAEDTAGQQAELTAEIETQIDKTKTLAGAWELLHGAQADADKEALEAQEAIERLGDTFAENAFKVDGNSRAARENRVALTDAARAAAEAAQAYLDQTGDAEGAAKMMDQFRRAAEKSIGATGKAKDEVHKLALELFKIPPSKTVLIKVLNEAALDKIQDVANKLSGIGFAHGGITGAAGGGPRGGMTLVGEQGPELVRLPYGSTVIPAGQSAAMMAGGSGGGGGRFVIDLRLNGRTIRELAIDDALSRGVTQEAIRVGHP